MADEKIVVITEIKVDTSEAVKASKDLDEQNKDTIDSTKDLTKETEDYTGALDGMIDNLGVLPAGLTKSLKGTTALTKGFKGLRLAIIATGIGALIIALGSLFTWFNRTSEGQEKLRVGMAAMGAFVDVLIDTFADLGEIIYNTFSDPKQAVLDLWEVIKTNMINRIKGVADTWFALGRIMKAAIDLDWDGVKQGAEDFGFAYQQIFTGVTKEQYQAGLDFIIEKAEEINVKTREAIKLQNIANEHDRDRIAFITREAELRRDISEERLKANKESLGATEQLEASNRALELTKQLYAEKIRLQEVEVELLRERQALGHNTIEDNEEMARQEAALIQLQQQAADMQRSIITKNESLRKRIANDELARIKTIDDANAKLQDDETKRLEKLADKKQKLADEDLKRQEDLNAAVYGGVAALLSAMGEDNKKLALASVVVNAANGVMKTISNLGLPWATPGIIAIGITAKKQLNEIRATEFARDGMLVGAPHSRGGVLINAEGGEAILNKQSMANPYLRGLASQINQLGGGVAFAQDGMLVGQSNTTNAINSMNRDIQRAFQQAPPVLVLEDLHSAEFRVRVKEEITTL